MVKKKITIKSVSGKIWHDFVCKYDNECKIKQSILTIVIIKELIKRINQSNVLGLEKHLSDCDFYAYKGYSVFIHGDGMSDLQVIIAFELLNSSIHNLKMYEKADELYSQYCDEESILLEHIELDNTFDRLTEFEYEQKRRLKKWET